MPAMCLAVQQPAVPCQQMCQAVILQAAVMKCTFGASADVQRCKSSATEHVAYAVTAILHATPRDRSCSHPEGWHEIWGSRTTAAHLGCAWILTIMRCLLLPSTCSACTARGLSVAVASLKGWQLSCAVQGSSSASGDGLAWHEWRILR